MKHPFLRKLCSLLLAWAVLLSSIPAAVFAAGEVPSPPAQEVDNEAPSHLTSETEESLPEEPLPDESQSNESLTEPTLPEPQPEESIPTESAPAAAVSQEDSEEPAVSGPGLYFGQLHAHTDISDGLGTVEEAFQYAAGVEGLDFFAVTDHSESFDQHLSGRTGTDSCAVSSDWAAGKAAASAVTSSSFVGIYGYEMSWPHSMQIGHISTFNTPGFQSWQQDAYSSYHTALQNYYNAISSAPGSIGQFNHPGTRYGTFEGFEYSPEADQVMHLLEVGSGDGTVGSSGYTEAYKYYTKALDLGWHLAPTNNQANHYGSWGDANTARTVVYAQSLTEAGIYDALRRCRAYATEDADLEILYSMDGYFMGSQIKQRDVGETADIAVSLGDPTDGSIGLVEVVTGGGAVVSQQTLASASGTLNFSFPPEAGYYYLRITQSDGDTAVTAPIWVEETEDLGISALTCETELPVQNEEIHLTLHLYNWESTDFQADSLEILADGNTVMTTTDIPDISGGGSFSHPLALSFDCAGRTTITAVLSGTLAGSPRTYEAEITLSFHQPKQLSGIVADAGSGNEEIRDLTILNALATEENISLITAEEISSEILEGCRFLLIPAPAEPFSDTYLAAVADFVKASGSLVVCGQGNIRDAEFGSAAELNRVLSAVGSTLRLREDTARDPVTSSGYDAVLFADAFNTDALWCAGLDPAQTYRHAAGCTVDPGSGTWLVRGHTTTLPSEPGGPVLLACEDLSGGGTVFTAGSLFLTDDDLAEPRNIWDIPYANRTLAQTLLDIGGEALPLNTVQEARTGPENELFRIRGYVTAGTSNPYTTFPDTLYLQDDSGGIAVVPFSGEDIQTGTPMEITGYAGTKHGNRILKVDSWKVLDAALYQYEPREGSWRTLLDAAANEGTLVAVEGECLEVYAREDGTLSGFLLRDERNRRVKVVVEDFISAGSDGVNRLHKKVRKGRTIHAAGILHVDEYGETVIRVRNCEEVVYVPPADSTNPRTHDPLPAFFPLLFPFLKLGTA